MSADNRICIMRDEDDQWCVWMGGLSDYYYQPPMECFRSQDKKQAMEYAEQMARDCVILEGGIEEITVHEQITAISMAIRELTYRLEKLRPFNGDAGESL